MKYDLKGAGEAKAVPAKSAFTISDKAAVGLFFIQRYRFLTIDQFAHIANMNRSTTTNQLLGFERHGLLGHFGNTRLAGLGKSPKVYFLTRKGWEILQRECGIPPELIGSHKEVHMQARWSPQMFHRLRLVDLMIAAEIGARRRPQLSIVRTFLEYKRVKRGERIVRETTDYIADEETAENRIVPDAAFILENIETHKRGLFFVEMDMGTERIVSQITRGAQTTVRHKFTQYDRYLTSGRFAKTYEIYDNFRYFILLFVTLSAERVEHIRNVLGDLSPELHTYYRFTTFDAAIADFFGAHWLSRSPEDQERYIIARGS